MLGLGVGLSRSSVASEITEILVYASDFTSNTDNWSNWGQALTSVEANQTAPDGSTGWLKQTFVSAIPVGANIGLRNGIVQIPVAAQGLVAWRFTGKVFFEEESNEWGGAVTAARISFADRTNTEDFDVNVVVDFEETRAEVPAFLSVEAGVLYVATGFTTVSTGAAWYFKDLRIYAVL
jgi:hypothetical protein